MRFAPLFDLRSPPNPFSVSDSEDFTVLPWSSPFFVPSGPSSFEQFQAPRVRVPRSTNPLIVPKIVHLLVHPPHSLFLDTIVIVVRV